MTEIKCKDCGKILCLGEQLLNGAIPDSEYNDLVVEGLLEFDASDLAFDCRCECGWYFRIYLGVKFTGFEVCDENSDDVKLL